MQQPDDTTDQTDDTASERTDTARYEWDLGRIYETPDAWDDAREELRDRLETLEATVPDVAFADADAVREFVDSVAAVYERKQRLELYAMLRRDSTDDPEGEARVRRYRDLEGEVETAIAAALDALSRADTVADTDDYRQRYLDVLQRRAAHRRDPAVEGVIGAFEEARSAPERTIRAITTEDFDPPTVERPDGEAVTITRKQYRHEQSHPDRAHRERVHAAYHDALRRFEATLATAYSEKLKAASALAEERGFDSLRDQQFHTRCYPETGLTAAFPTGAHDAMLDTLRERTGPRERARRLRADRLGVDALRPWDTRAPVVETPEVDLSFADVREHICEALAPLGEDYVAQVRDVLDSGRVDAFEREGKRSDVPAYCFSSAADGPFVLLNHENVRTMYYLCHELGHAVHVERERDGPALYATCPRPVEEVPSVLHEILLVEHCLDEGGALAAHARSKILERIEGYLYGSATASAWTTELARRVEAGEELDARTIGAVYAEMQTAYDPVLELPEGAERDWVSEGLLRDPFHHYQYVYGAVGALAVREHLRDGDLSTDDYLSWLGATGRRPATDSFAALGLDVASPAPYERALSVFDDYIEAV